MIVQRFLGAGSGSGRAGSDADVLAALTISNLVTYSANLPQGPEQDGSPEQLAMWASFVSLSDERSLSGFHLSNRWFICSLELERTKEIS